MMRRALSFLCALGLLVPLGSAQARVSAVAVNPANPAEVWACNRANNSVSVIDVTSRAVTEIDVDVWPRSLAFSADGSKVFVANQRGNVPVDTNFVTPFAGSEIRGTISVIDTTLLTVIQTLTNVGTEPYGLVVAPNGEYFAVTGHRSGTVKFYDTDAPHSELLSFQYDRSLNFIAPGKTLSDVDSNSDWIPDLDEPRAMVISSDSTRAYVTHSLPGFVSVLDFTLLGGVPTVATLNTKVDLDLYPFHPIFNPVPVQTLQSQGVPRFLDDIDISPSGDHLLVPHVLHNINHDVNHDFGPGLAGDFANRVYPALSVVDASALSFGQGGDDSARLHHELSDSLTPAELVPYGGAGTEIATGIISMGATGSPLPGATLNFQTTGTNPADLHLYFFSLSKISIPTPFGTLLTQPNNLFGSLAPTASINIPNNPALIGVSGFFQAAIYEMGTFMLLGLSNGLEVVIGSEGFAPGKMGYRAGHPGRVLYNADGDRAIMLNRASEDVFLYDVSGSTLTLRTVFPPRHDFAERPALDTGSPMGDLPLGMALVDDTTTSNRDSILYIINETTRTLSGLRIDWDTAVITQEIGQITTVLGPDEYAIEQLLGQEMFEDASRPQTAGNFNNSCGSCHFEGGADGNVWQRSAGPRSTMPVYGGTLLTGLILWKGVRINLGETGPMFGGENGGHGILTDLEQQGLTNYHEIIPVPLNPNLDPITGDYSPNAAFGKDLFHGTDDTGLNPTMRAAGCADCHPDFDDQVMEIRGYTEDHLSPLLTSGENLEALDPDCFTLRENIVAENIRNVNSGVNVDGDNNGIPDIDRNADGFDDRETYAPMNDDGADDFTRDDPNSYLCPEDPMDPMSPLRVFTRPSEIFSIPTKLGVFSTGPYFHDHSLSSLRAVLDPQMQTTDPIYGDPSFPSVNKFFNEFHDVRGNDMFVLNASKVQLTLQTIASGSTIDADVSALLEYIRSL